MLEYNVKVISDYENEIEVKLSYDDIKPEIEAAYKEERKTITHPGFRKGKVPLSILKKMYGEAIEYKASEQIANKKFWDVVDEKDLKPISTPHLSDIIFNPGENLEFKVKYEIKPEIEVKDYKSQKIEKPVFKVKEEDIEAEVKNLLKSAATFEEAEKTESEDYRITVDLQKVDEAGVEMEGQKSANIAIDLSDEKVSPQIRQNAIDKKVGETFNFEFVDEHMHGEEKHTETYRYVAKITKIEKIVIPEADAEYFKKVTKDKATNIEELKDFMRDNFEKYYEQQSESIFGNNLLDTIVKNNDFTAPPGYVQLLAERMTEAEIENAKRKNTRLPEKNILLENIKPRAEWNAKWQIIMEKIVDLENLKVEDADLEALAKEEADKTGISEEKLMNFYRDSRRADTLLEDKVIAFLKENNTIKEVDAEEKAKEIKEKANDK
ncbi:MAG: trigger factor [Bacteroidetes bacterium]|nr:trigger factor [Bacteroidota bacterium]